MDANKIEALAREMGAKPADVESFILGLSIFVNQGCTFEEAIAKLQAMWLHVLEQVSTLKANAHHMPVRAQALRGWASAHADGMWDAVHALPQPAP